MPSEMYSSCSAFSVNSMKICWSFSFTKFMLNFATFSFYRCYLIPKLFKIVALKHFKAINIENSDRKFGMFSLYCQINSPNFVRKCYNLCIAYEKTYQESQKVERKCLWPRHYVCKQPILRICLLVMGIG